MQSVLTTHAFVRAAQSAGMSDTEVESLVDYLAENPRAGDVIQGIGGYRKVRWAMRGKGKSGGYRSITFYSGEALPLFLITVFGKGEKASLSKAERNELQRLTKVLVESFTTRLRRPDR